MGQIIESSAIEIASGDTAILVEIMKQYPDFIASLKGKTIGGSSAGAYIFARHFYNSKTGGVLRGLDVFPVRISGHMNNREFGLKEDIVKALSEVNDDSETLLLDECEWVEKVADI
ncbi:MAG: hypothetical protein ACI9T8_000522 [Candidatus Saccharimonadales bacterium]|jgi:hypothetical protein